MPASTHSIPVSATNLSFIATLQQGFLRGRHNFRNRDGIIPQFARQARGCPSDW